MEDLLKAEKTNPLDAEKANPFDETDVDYSVTGEDRPPVSMNRTTVDHKNNTQLAPGARARVTKSKIMTGEGANQKPDLLRSIVVTPQEKVIVLSDNTANRIQTGRKKLNQSVVLPAENDGIKKHSNLAKSMVIKGNGTGVAAKEMGSGASVGGNDGNVTKGRTKFNQSLVLPEKSDGIKQHHNLAKSMVVRGNNGTGVAAKGRGSAASVGGNGGNATNNEITSQTARIKLNQSVVLLANSDGIKKHSNLAKSMVVKGSGTGVAAKGRGSVASVASNNSNGGRWG